MKTPPAPTGHVEQLALVEWVRALEEQDSLDSFLSNSDREQATLSALAERGVDSTAPAKQKLPSHGLTFFARRGQLLLQKAGLQAQSKLAIQLALSPSQRAFIITILVALVVGFSADRWGGGRRMDLLASPLALLLILNGLLYLARLVGLLFPRGQHSDSGGTFAGLLRSVSEWRARRRFPASEVDPKRDWMHQAYARFLDGWSRICGPLLAVRVRCLLDFSAAALLLGTLLGLYSRGLTRAFSATWESTWLAPETVSQLLKIILAPAAWILQTSVPDAAPLQLTPAPAGEWIHLYAMTAALFVLIPRCLLGLAGALRARHMERSLSHDASAPYFRRILSRGNDRGRGLVLPYSHQPSVAMLEQLLHELNDALGSRTVIDVGSVTAYGDSLSPETFQEEARWVLLLFNVAQTAEIEVHAEWVSDIIRLSEPATVIAALDPAPYLAKVRDPARVSERVAGWKRVLADSGLLILTLPRVWSDPNQRREFKEALGAMTSRSR